MDIDTTKTTIPFSYLNIGDVLMYGGSFYIKVESGVEEVNVVNLADGIFSYITRDTEVIHKHIRVSIA